MKGDHRNWWRYGVGGLRCAIAVTRPDHCFCDGGSEAHSKTSRTRTSSRTIEETGIHVKNKISKCSKTMNDSRFLREPACRLLLQESQMIVDCVHDASQVRVDHVSGDAIKQSFCVIRKASVQRADPCDFFQGTLTDSLIFRYEGAGDVQSDLGS